MDSRCPGHPEYRWTSGVETTTGPLGQGYATSVGMAIAGKWLADHYNRPGFDMFGFKVYAMGGDDASLRPNQIYAVAFPGELLDAKQAKRVVQVVEERLLTPVGLRTLAPGDPQYRPRYEGGVHSRDGAYHQGTVWPFLLGPFVTAWLRVHGQTAETRRQARAFLSGIEQHLGEACIGQVSEIFDADAPHLPRGCFAQAWSVAEPLRALIEDLGGREISVQRPAPVEATAKASRKKGRPAAR